MRDRGRLAEAEGYLREAARLNGGPAGPDPMGWLTPAVNLTRAVALQGRLGEAERLLTEARAATDRLGQPDTWRATVLGRLGEVYGWAGRDADAAACLARAVALYGRTGSEADRWKADDEALRLAAVYVRLGRPDDAAAEFRRQAARPHLPPAWQTALPVAAYHLKKGDPAAAQRALAGERRRTAAAPPNDIYKNRLQLAQGEAEVQAGDRAGGWWRLRRAVWRLRRACGDHGPEYHAALEAAARLFPADERWAEEAAAARAFRAAHAPAGYDAVADKLRD